MFKVQNKIKEIIKEQGQTIYSLSNETGIERTYLTKILSGKRNFSLDKFLLILDTLNVAGEEKKQLIEDYINENFSKSKFETYGEYLSTSFLKENEKSTSITEIKADFMVFHNRRKLMDFVEYFLSTKNRSDRLYTNFPTSTILSLGERRTDCDFRCIVANTETKEVNISVFDLIKLSLYCCVTYVEKNATEKPKNEFYPYAMIADDSILLANKGLDKGYYLKNKDIADMYANDFCHIIKGVNANSQIYDDILNVKEIIQKNIFFKKVHRVITSNFFAIAFMNYDEFEELAREDLPERQYLIDITHAYYREFFNSTDLHKFIISHDSITDFCETGIIHEMPISYSRPLSLETRLNILKRIIQALEETPSKVSLNFLKNSKPTDFEINLDIETGVSKDSDNITSIVMSGDESKTNYFPGNYFFLSTDKNANSDFNDYFDLLSVSSYVMTKDESLEVLKDRALRLEYAVKAQA